VHSVNHVQTLKVVEGLGAPGGGKARVRWGRFQPEFCILEDSVEFVVPLPRMKR
jgi:hypothetical protein